MSDLNSLCTDDYSNLVLKLEKTGDHQTDYQINSKDLLNIVDEDLDQHVIKNVKKEISITFRNKAIVKKRKFIAI